MDWDPLVQAAQAARENSYSPYSSFAVGAAVRVDDGRIFAGCNIENRTFGLTICAERVAVGSAVARGARHLAAVAVVTDTDPPAVPCGLCLETLTEFGSRDLPVMLANLDGRQRVFRLSELLPHPFEFPPPS